MNRPQNRESDYPQGLSHASGSESLASELAGKEIGSVPREWECIAVHEGQEYCHLGCPTRVGMNRTNNAIVSKVFGLFHASGSESHGCEVL